MTRLVKMDIRIEKADLDSARLLHRQRVARAIQTKTRLPREAEVHREIYHRGLKGQAEEMGLIQPGLIQVLCKLDRAGVIVTQNKRFYVIPVNPEAPIHPDHVVYGPTSSSVPNSKPGRLFGI
jgi:hypothetical protein